MECDNDASQDEMAPEADVLSLTDTQASHADDGMQTDGPMAPAVYRQEFEQNRQKWQSQNLQDYTFRFGEFCEDGGCNVDIVLVVRDREVVGELDTVTREPVQTGRATTIDGVFLRLAAILEGANPVKFDVSYDSGRGYPTTGSVNVIANAIDDEFDFEVQLLSVGVENPGGGSR